MNIFGSFGDEGYVPEPNPFISLKVVDQHDRHAPHFLELTINQMKIWFSFDEPIGFLGRTACGILKGLTLNNHQEVHSYKIESHFKGRRSLCRTFRLKYEFTNSLMTELKKEIIHTSSEVMQTTLLGKE